MVACACLKQASEADGREVRENENGDGKKGGNDKERKAPQKESALAGDSAGAAFGAWMETDSSSCPLGDG